MMFVSFLPAELVTKHAGPAMITVQRTADGADGPHDAYLTQLCCSTSVHPPSVDRHVRMPRQVFARHTQTFRLVKTLSAYVESDSDFEANGRLAVFGVSVFLPHAKATADSAPGSGAVIPVTLRVYAPQDAVSPAKRVTLRVGPSRRERTHGAAGDVASRGHAKLDTAALLSVSLVGAVLVPGAKCSTDSGEYEVIDGGIVAADSASPVSVFAAGAKVLLNSQPNSASATSAATSTSDPSAFPAEAVQASRRALLAAAQAAKAGGTAGVLLSGPPSNGKSELIRHLASELQCVTVELTQRVGSEESSGDSTHDVRAAVKDFALSHRGKRPAAVWLWIPRADEDPLLLAHGDTQSAVGTVSDSAVASVWFDAVCSASTQCDVVAPDAASAVAPPIIVVAESRDHTLLSTALLGGLFNNRLVMVPLLSLAQRTAVLSRRIHDAGIANTLARRSAGQPLAALYDTIPALAVTSVDEALRVELPVPASQKTVKAFAMDLRQAVASFDAVGGLDDVKQRLRRSLLLPLEKPETFKRLNLTPPKGVLLYGPPGCAKTTLVKALCKEASFALLYLDCASVLSAYVGESEARLRAVFRAAREQAPAIIFFDEVDAVAGARKHGAGASDGMATRLLATLLIEMDGMTSNPDVCFIGATNLPFVMDAAIMRPGRFDELVYVPLPTAEDRLSIVVTKLRPLVAIASGTEGNDDEGTLLPAVSQEVRDAVKAVSNGMSGADISGVCREIAVAFIAANTLEDGAGVHDAPALWSSVLNDFVTRCRTSSDSRRSAASGSKTDYAQRMAEFISRHDVSSRGK